MQADGDNLIVVGDIDLGDRHFLPEHVSHERKSEMLLDHGEEPNHLFRLVIGIDSCFLDQVIEVCRGGISVSCPLAAPSTGTACSYGFY